MDSRILSLIKGNQVIREGWFSLAMCFICFILQLSYFKIHFIVHSFPLLNYRQYIILFCDLTIRRLNISLVTLWCFLNYWQYIILFCDLTIRRLSISLVTLWCFLNYWQYIILFCDLTIRRLNISLVTLWCFCVYSSIGLFVLIFNIFCYL